MIEIVLSRGNDDFVVKLKNEHESIYNIFKSIESIMLLMGYTNDEIQDYYHEIINQNNDK